MHNDKTISEDSFLRRAYIEILNNNIKVVSFDFFDTTAKRSSLHPVDFFNHIGRLAVEAGILRSEISPNQFTALRISAEQKAREKNRAVTGKVEVNLVQIWEHLASALNKRKSAYDAAQFEFDVERSFMFGNPFAIDLIEFALKNKKRVIIASDTYFSSGQIAEIFRIITEGRKNVEISKISIFSSNEYGSGKCEQLFQKIVDEIKLPPDKILHIGDNYKSDIECSSMIGINASFIPNGLSEIWEIIDRENRYCLLSPMQSCSPERELILGRLASVRSTLGALQAVDSSFSHFLYGATVLGPLFDAYLRWVEDRIRPIANQVVICGLLREGGFLADLLRERCPDLQIVKLGVSRLALIRSSLRTVSRSALNDALPYRHPITLGQFARRIGLLEKDFPAGYRDKNIWSNDPAVVDDIISYILDNRDLVKKISEFSAGYYKRMKRHIDSKFCKISSEQDIVLLDLGWAASIQEKLVNNFGIRNENLIGLYLALNDRGMKRSDDGLRVAGFMFDGPASHPLAAHGLRFVEILEQAATPDHGSVVDYGENGDPIFAVEKISGEQIEERKEVQKGICKFVETSARCQPHTWYDGRAARGVAQLIFLRSVLSPTNFEREIFKNWYHDDSFSDGTLDGLVPQPHYRLANYLSPRQVADYAFEVAYWPQGTNHPQGAYIANQAALGMLLWGDFSYFTHPSNLSFDVSVRSGKKSERIFCVAPETNFYGGFAVEFKIDGRTANNCQIKVSAKEKEIFHIDIIIFRRLGFGSDKSGGCVVIEGAMLSKYVVRDKKDLGSGKAFSVGDGIDISLKFPEEVMSWEGYILISMGCVRNTSLRNDTVITNLENKEDIVVDGWFDSILDIECPVESNVNMICEGDSIVHTTGWCIDCRNWMGPDSVNLVLEGNGRRIVFPAHLYPRPDIPRGFGRVVIGPAGIKARVLASKLELGRFSVMWQAVFSGNERILVAPYTIIVDVDPQQMLDIRLEKNIPELAEQGVAL